MNKNKKFTDAHELLMTSLSKFYSNKQIVSRILPIIDGKCEVSLRLIDWFVTNYAKKNSTIITRLVNNNVIHFNVYLSYRAQLKAYSKQQFDPFRRRERISFFYDKDKSVETTVGQLNFFKWVLQNDLIDYINKHYAAIEKDMINTQKANTSTKSGTDTVKAAAAAAAPADIMASKKKRNELSKSCLKNMNRFNGLHTLAFN